MPFASNAFVASMVMSGTFRSFRRRAVDEGGHSSRHNLRSVSVNGIVADGKRFVVRADEKLTVFSGNSNQRFGVVTFRLHLFPDFLQYMAERPEMTSQEGKLKAAQRKPTQRKPKQNESY
jgi:hypothetical protein